MKPYQTILYYCYSFIDSPQEFAARHLEFCNLLELKGRVIVAAEGLNGSVSGTREACAQYMEAIHADPRFTSTEFKIDEVDEPSFLKMHCRAKSEIVHSGLRDTSVINPLERTGKHLEPAEFSAVKDHEDVVLLDVRSNYEHRLGRFKNAVTLDIDNFRDFPAKLDQLKPALAGKKVITYCTGGIKCEKASALLLQAGFENVYQLRGGIIKYGKEQGGRDFDGRCYVFDNRISVEVNSVNPATVATCLNCGTATERMVNCANQECNEHFVQCPSCGNDLSGCCSAGCMESPVRRKYDGTGYYVKKGVFADNFSNL